MRVPTVLPGFLRKEFRQLLRSREMLVVLFALPLAQLLIMGFAVTNEVKNIRISFFDRDRSPRSRELVSAFSSTDRFRIVPTPSLTEPYSMLKAWKSQIVVTIPPGFGRDLSAGRKPSLQVLVDGIDSNGASIGAAYVNATLQRYLEGFQARTDPMVVSRLSGTGGQTRVVPRLLFNPDLKSSIHIIPGIIALLVTVTSMMLSAISLVREKELGTLEQLMVSPVSKWQLLAGKLLPYLILTFIQMLCTMLFAALIYGTRVAGSLPLLLGFSAVYLATTLGLGILISTLVSSQQQAMFFAWFVMVVVILLSGFFVPVQNMPAAVRAFSFLNPMRHYMTVVREIVIKGTPAVYLAREFFILLGMGLLCFGASVLTFHKRV
jgi:ABC-2 type transport system permease protein